MPIFISYSHKDSEFVDVLARNLVHNRHHIWLDRWELNVGDSLLEKIQKALTGSSAVLITLSRAGRKQRLVRPVLAILTCLMLGDNTGQR